MAAGNFDTVVADAIAQVEAGAQMLDVNAGIPLADEPAILARGDSARAVRHRRAALHRLLDRRGARGRALPSTRARRSSTRSPARTSSSRACSRWSRATARRWSRSRTTRTGISEDPDVRFEVARKIVSRAAEHGIPKDDVVVDPLVMPIGAIGSAGTAGVQPRPPAARGARRQHHLRRVEHQLRSPEPTRPQRRVPADGDRVRDDLGDHEPAARGGAQRGLGGRRDDGERRALRDLDRAARRDAVGGCNAAAAEGARVGGEQRPE